MDVFKLLGTIAVDNSGAISAMDDTVGKAKQSEGTLTKAFKRIGTAVVTAFTVDKIVDFGKQCVNAYASIAAQESAFSQIMGDYADTAQQKLNAVADQTGVSSSRLTSAMTSLTAKFKGLGYSVEDATTLASDGLLIASDAAAFWDMSLDESMSHLNSFINGSYEGGEAIGLFANDTQMAAYAVEQGIVKDAKAWAQLDEATKQATRLDYAKRMMEQSGATGQAAKEADAYANVQANLTAAWTKFTGVIGKPIMEKFVLPGMRKLLEFMPGLTDAVTNGIDWLSNGFDKIASYFTEVFTEDGIKMDALPKALKNMFRDLGRSVSGLLAGFGRSLSSGWNNVVWPLIQRTFKATFNVDVPEWADFKQSIVDWWTGEGGVKQQIANVCNWTLNLFGAPATVTEDDVSKVLDTWWTNTKAFVANACSWVLNLFGAPDDLTAQTIPATFATWWSNSVSAVQDACTWVLQLFGAPDDLTKETLPEAFTTWWGKAKSVVQNACDWVLGMFGKPAGTVTVDGLRNMLGTWWSNAKAKLGEVCTWALNLFNSPDDPDGSKAAGVVDTWWNGVKGKINEICKVDLTNIDIAGVFNAAGTAIANLVSAAKTLATDIANALDTDTTGKFRLNGILSSLFSAGTTAMANILTTASTLVTDVVGSITGNAEGAQKIGAVFGDLFGVAKEVTDGVVSIGTGVFDWFLQNGELVAPIITAVAFAMAKFVFANPAIAVITALTTLLTAMTVDWNDFESKYPHLVKMFEDLTGLDFTNVADSLSTFQGGLQGIVDWFTKNETTLDMMLMVLGGMVFFAHPVAGAALIAYGAGDLWTAEGAQKDYAEDLEETGVPKEIQNPFINNSDSFIDWASMWSWLANAPGNESSDEPEVYGPPTPDWFKFDDAVPTGSNGAQSLLTSLQALTAQLTGLPDQIAASAKNGVAEGVGAITITGTVTTGDMRLDTGALVGQLTPKMNLKLGTMTQHALRMG